jgi:hypothetical protein
MKLPTKTALALCGCAGILTMVLLAGCSSTAGTQANAQNNSNNSSTVTPGGAGSTTPTTGGNTTIQTCQQVSGFSGASTVPEGGRLSNVPFPANAQSTQAVDTVNQTGLYEVMEFNVCAPNTSPSALHSFYASQFPSMGWAQSSTYPYDGGYQASCGDPYCWEVGSTPEFSSLENVQAASGGYVTYRMRLAFPPTLPDCSNIELPGNAPTLRFVWDQMTSVPLPPLTIEGMVDDSTVGGEAVTSTHMCSPGTASSISAFMSKELGHHGWRSTSQTLCGSTDWYLNAPGDAISWNVSNPQDWTLNTCIYSG